GEESSMSCTASRTMSRTPREMEPYSPVSDRRRRQHRCLLQPSLSVARVLVRGKLNALGKEAME
uniref:Uncharacterized protein n=2 Tax=Aegilops tauschii subsp. strangulata TaxID=200361 RepID=A0A453K8U4_AEGTS